MEKKFGGKLVRRGVAKLLRRGELRPREGGEESLGQYISHDVHPLGLGTSIRFVLIYCVYGCLLLFLYSVVNAHFGPQPNSPTC